MNFASGTRLGPYEIVAPLGAGGMGEVYLARDATLSRDIAIKVLPSAFASDPDWLRRFQQEAQAAGTLNHPNLVTIHELGTRNGVPYICMELLEGETLRNKLEEHGNGTRVPLRKAIDYATQLAHGLAAAHDKGIVHRDLKPENIFITRDGRVKILDFGLAKLPAPLEGTLTKAQTRARATTPGTVMGTMGYMSPEQVRGQPADPRTDIFALGAILYEMLSGKRAFHGDTAADTMSAILHEEPPEIYASNPNVSPGVDRIVRHCLEKNPEERFQSARDVAFDLQSISNLSGSAPSVSNARFGSKQKIALTAGIIGILLGAITTAAVKTSRMVRPAPREVTRLTFQAGVERYPSLSPDGKSVVYVSEAPGKPDIYLQRVDGRNAINLTKDSRANNVQPAFSPDGEQIAFRSERNGGGIFVMGATGESVRRLTSFGYNPAWSPDGTEIVFSNESVDLTPRDRAGRGGLWIVGVKTGTVRQLTKHDSVQANWSPHGERIAYWGLVGEGGQRDIWTIAAHDANPDKTIVPVTNDPALDWNPFWSDDGKYLYFGSDRDGTMNLWRISIDEKSGKTEGGPEPMNLPTEFAAHFTEARAANVIAFSSVSQTFAVERYSLNPLSATSTGPPTTVFSGSLPITDFAVSPDGSEIVFATRGKQEDLFIMNSDGSNVRQLTNDPEKDRGPSWSRDGNTIYFFSHRGRRYEIWSIRPDGSGLTQITHSPDTMAPLWYPTISPDGSRLLTYNASGSYIWTLGGSTYEALPRTDPEHVLSSSCWSPDGRSIIGRNERAADGSKTDGIVRYSFATKRFEKVSDDETFSESDIGGPVLVWLPDARHIIYAVKDHLVQLDLATKQRHEIGPPVTGLSTIALSQDGRSLYVVRVHTEADLWLVTDRQQ